MAIGASVAVGTSVYSSAHAAHQRKKAERALEGLKAPKYTPNQSILDYYQSALQKYNTNPTDSAAYKLQTQNLKQGTVQGLNALRDRRLGGGVSTLINNQNNGQLKLAMMGEQQKARDFSVLGQATGMKASEEGKEFNFNEIRPFEQKYNLLAAKAGGQAQVENASLQNAYNGGMSLATYAAANKRNKAYNSGGNYGGGGFGSGGASGSW